MLQPSIVDLKREKDSSGPQHAVNFRERAILQLDGAQVMQDENGDGRRKTAIRKRQSRGVTLQNAATGPAPPGHQLCGKSMAILDTGNPRRPPPQFLRRCAWARANLQQVLP